MRQTSRVLARALVAAVAVLVATAPAQPALASQGGSVDLAPTAVTSYFLGHYEKPDGRVVRPEDGGDSVSEGQAYAMLLSVAVGDRARFDAAWKWAEQHLLQPTGLMAWHWQGGRVVDSQPASDADVDAAVALELASRRFHSPVDRRMAVSLATAIVAHETVMTSAGPVLVAGPWATSPVAYADPSYATAGELSALGVRLALFQLTAMASTTRSILGQLRAQAPLPPDWVRISASGHAVPALPPGTPAPDLYGYDAVRLPVRLAASCDSSDKVAAGAMWAVLHPRAEHGRDLVDLSLDGASTFESSTAPIGYVGAAAAAWASHHRDAALALLRRAEQANLRAPTYYASAWIGLATEMLETSTLSLCGR